MIEKLRIATRGSALALAQTKIVADELKKHNIECEVIIVKTKGDANQTTPLDKIGGNGLFVREIEKALLSNEADIAVHSAKDLPAKLFDGLIIAGTPKAGRCGDSLIYKNENYSKKGGVIGTSSARRIVECKKHFPDATCESIRGNIDTRIKKLKEGDYDAIVMASAAMDRLPLNLSGLSVHDFSAKEFIPSACQGILAVECRNCDKEIIDLLESISDEETTKRFVVERELLSLLEADCSMPLGIYCEMIGEEKISLHAMYNKNRIDLTGEYSSYKELCQMALKELKYE